MNGRRIPIERGTDPTTVLERPGDYAGPVLGYTGDAPAVFLLLPVKGVTMWGDEPCSGLHHVCMPPHVFRECADGSLEIRESIGAHGRRGEQGYVWHGYLDEGHVWREC